jgi:Rha family phage regulatory protein
MSNLTALCAELRMHAENGVPLVNSRDVADKFGKRHTHVLTDIDRLRTSAEISADLWFHPATVLDGYGREQPSFNLTRQGFTLLVMGWTGERAMQFKVRYIEAFDAMEAELRERAPLVTTDGLISAVREIVAPLAVRFDGQDQAIEQVKTEVRSVAGDVAWIKHKLTNKRNLPTRGTLAEHEDSVKLLGGKCPCCGIADVIVDGKRSQFADCDHFYQNSLPNVEHTWIICRPCHNDLTHGRVSRDQREAEFRAYQNKRRRLPGRQAKLF